MSEQTGPSLAAIRARQSVMATKHDSVAEADRALMNVLASAHTATRESIRRLDTVADEIERAVPRHRGLAVDTPMGAPGVPEVPGGQAAGDCGGGRGRARP